jgi:1,4-dihydroxy-2-naphthoyl-CoA hydrolase
MQPIECAAGRPGASVPAMSTHDELAAVWSTMPFAQTIGSELLEADSSGVRARLAWDQSRCTAGGALHGGVLMSLADSAAAVCAFLNLPEGASGTTTVESKTNFLRAVREGSVTASSTPLHKGRRFVVVETELRDDADRLVAKVTQTQAVL